MMKKLKPTIVLTAICLISALLLSVVNMFTAPIVAERDNLAANAALLEVLPNGSSFEKLESLDGLPEAITDAWRAPEGYVFKTNTTGWAPGMIIMIGVDADGKITGSKCLAAEETYGFENKLDGEYNGVNFDSLELIIAAGASPNSSTSKGYYAAIHAALQAFVTLGGGDSRTPEQIFADNCNLVLGTEGKKFTRAFVPVLLSGVDAIYTTGAAEDGYVIAIGEMLIAVKDGSAENTVGAYDKEGAITPAQGEEKAAAEAAVTAISAPLTEIARPDGAKATVKKAYVTAGGTYVFEMETSGSYADEGEYSHGSGKIQFTVSIGADGKIIDIITTKHGESKNYGANCATEAFYESFRGATREQILDLDISDIIPNEDNGYETDNLPNSIQGPGIIANATFTTVYYHNAVLDAFDAFLKLTEKI